MKLTCAVCCLTIIAGIAAGQSNPPANHTDSADHHSTHVERHQPGRIVGIFDAASMAPIEGAEVVDIFTDATARTPANGLIELSAFHSRNDSAAIRVRKIGYADTALVVMVGRADTVPLSLFLTKAAETLPGMITEAMGSDNRFVRGLGDFVDLMNDKSSKSTVFTPVELRKTDGRQLENALFDKGVGAGRCKAKGFQLYIDGIKQTTLGIPSGTTSDQFEAAIFYEGTPPIAYNMTSGRGCGTLLLWTRRNVLP